MFVYVQPDNISRHWGKDDEDFIQFCVCDEWWYQPSAIYVLGHKKHINMLWWVKPTLRKINDLWAQSH